MTGSKKFFFQFWDSFDSCSVLVFVFDIENFKFFLNKRFNHKIRYVWIKVTLLFFVFLNCFFIGDEILFLRSSFGNPEYQFRLGYVFSRGRGIIKQNKIEAARHYQMAAIHDYAKAQLFLGFSYEKGEGVNKNMETAKFWYSRAAKNGNDSAKQRLQEIDK